MSGRAAGGVCVPECACVSVCPYVGADEALWGESVKPPGESGFSVCQFVELYNKHGNLSRANTQKKEERHNRKFGSFLSDTEKSLQLSDNRSTAMPPNSNLDFTRVSASLNTIHDKFAAPVKMDDIRSNYVDRPLVASCSGGHKPLLFCVGR